MGFACAQPILRLLAVIDSRCIAESERPAQLEPGAGNSVTVFLTGREPPFWHPASPNSSIKRIMPWRIARHSEIRWENSTTVLPLHGCSAGLVLPGRTEA